MNINDKVKCCILFLNRKSLYSISFQRGDSILTYAVRGGFLDIVKSLLAKYADVNAKDSSGRTALFIAVDKG